MNLDVARWRYADGRCLQPTRPVRVYGFLKYSSRMSLTTSFRTAVQLWGFRGALWRALMGRARPWIMIARVTVRRLRTERVEFDPGEGITMRQATRDDLSAAIGDGPGALERVFVDAAVARGDVCFGAFHGSKMIAYTWASFAVAPHGDGLWVTVATTYEYAYKSFTHPDFRGRGIIGQVSRLRDNHSVEQGCRWTVGFVETHNYGSYRANRRLGSRTVGYAGYLKVLGHAFPFRTPGAVRHGFRFFHP